MTASASITSLHYSLPTYNFMPQSLSLTRVRGYGLEGEGVVEMKKGGRGLKRKRKGVDEQSKDKGKGWRGYLVLQLCKKL